jgi:hypothetical protein
MDSRVHAEVLNDFVRGLFPGSNGAPLQIAQNTGEQFAADTHTFVASMPVLAEAARCNNCPRRPRLP